MPKFNRDRFWSSYITSFGEAPMGRRIQIERLLGYIEVDIGGLAKEVRWASYFLATTQHETANTFAPIEERGKLAYFDKYDAGTPIGARLGNTEKGDGYRYRYRGYIQVTGRGNYTRFSTICGVDLIAVPELALEADIAYKIASVGMQNGLFTGRRLGQYFGTNKCDWIGARAIINGKDCAERIGGYAQRWLLILQGSVDSG